MSYFNDKIIAYFKDNVNKPKIILKLPNIIDCI